MKKSLLIFLPLYFCLFINQGNSQNSRAYNQLVEDFKNPPEFAQPKVYWWCLNGNIDTIRAKEELWAMKQAGIGGFDLFEIGTPPQDTMIPAGPAFLSDESLKVIKFMG